jgi:spore coat protein U-like protein
MRRFVFAVAALSLSLMAVTNASADIITTLSSWEAAGSFTLGDKTFTYISESNINGAAAIEFHSLGNQTYSVVLGGLVDNLTATTGDLKYSVSITSGSLHFYQAALDVNAVGISPSYDVTKSIYSDSGYSSLIGSINHTNTNAPGPIGISPYTTIYVDDSLSYVSGTGELSNVTNTFSQVPEPSTFALLGLGGVGLAIRAYRRRQPKVVA